MTTCLHFVWEGEKEGSERGRGRRQPQTGSSRDILSHIRPPGLGESSMTAVTGESQALGFPSIAGLIQFWDYSCGNDC